MRLAAAAIVLVAFAPPAFAQRVTAEDIVNALQARGGAAAAAFAPGRLRVGVQGLVAPPADAVAGQPARAMSVIPPAEAVNPPGRIAIPPAQFVVNPPGNGGHTPPVAPMVVNPPPQFPPVAPMIAQPIPQGGGGPRPIAIPAPLPVMQAALPSIDLEIFFDTDSAEILPRSRDQLLALGYALSDPRLAWQHFLVAGHTDARGSDAYNRDLSDRRAASVKSFLIQQFPIQAAYLQVVGYGESYLRDPSNPDAGVNRRVQIVNLGQ